MWPILSNLNLGDREDSRDRRLLAEYGITHIVNCAAELPCCYPNDFEYLALNLSDPDDKFIAKARPALAFIDRGRNAGGVLVHCTAGVSRSAAVVLEYLCYSESSLEDACIQLSRKVLTGIDEAFLAQIATNQQIVLSRTEIQRLSLVLAGRG